MTDDASRRVRLRIHGRVQGVFFRAGTRDRARELGVDGWVRNREDGTVEAVVEGPVEAVDRLVDWCHEGPPAARVESVDVAEEAPSGDLAGFDVRR